MTSPSSRRRRAWRPVAAVALVVGLLVPVIQPSAPAAADPSDTIAGAVDRYDAARRTLDDAQDDLQSARGRRDIARDAWEQASFDLSAAETRLTRRLDRFATLSTEFYVRQGADDDVVNDSIRLALSGSREQVDQATEFHELVAEEEEDTEEALAEEQQAFDAAIAERDDALAAADATRADADATLAAAGAGELPAVAYIAYRDAAARANEAHPECGLSPAVLAGIGMLSSGHARNRDGTIDHSGRIEAPPRSSTRVVGLDVAVGPLQIPESLWVDAATDGDGDGAVSRQDFFDAATTTAEALCAPGDALETFDALDRSVQVLLGEGQQATVALGIGRRYALVEDLGMGDVPEDPRGLVVVEGNPQFDTADTAFLPGDVVGMLGWALSRVGTPYSQCLGPSVRPQDPVCPPGTNRFGVGFFDCSGFVSNAYRRIGIRVPLTTYAMEADPAFMATKVSDGIDFSVMEPGDVFLMNGHTGMYVGGGMIVHAIGRGLTYEPVPRWVANGTIAVLRPLQLL